MGRWKWSRCLSETPEGLLRPGTLPSASSHRAIGPSRPAAPSCIIGGLPNALAMLTRYTTALSEREASSLAEKLTGKRIVAVRYMFEEQVNYYELVFDDDSRATFYYEGDRGGVTVVEGFP
jgi:hypothetical protein